ncbi:dTDP-4-dehydrorhamnose reductase [Methylomagnum ishizawai]|uniref:dTDP-4-dehydrorhamnose reductase n=1 Tax=Methylomagnum ishizawai TaxID=1760988 RepID=UPI001C33357C|nr:dTDP-4-dehydrorhamnose reductase [Methylomagnum ishizawai]BBL74226.1 NAD(P)-dependent oxidoreductase [Methylomagnum ishizawai]
MKILLIGRQGQVAYELRRTLACLGEVVALDRQTSIRADLADLQSLRDAVNQIQPELIVNAGAYTAVDKAEQDTELAFRVNGEAPGVLAEAARAVDAGLIHYSTDYVFPGDADTAYVETDAIGPLSAYGKSKLAGEEAIRQVGVPHLILRTAWVYGRRGQNFLLTMLRLMRERESLRVVADQHGAPTWSRMIAEATALLVARTTYEGRFEPAESGGTYHLTCGGRTTWYGFAAKIREMGLAQGLLPETCAKLEAIPTSGYPTPAHRPAFSVLSNQKLLDEFELALPDWEDGLALCLEEMRG